MVDSDGDGVCDELEVLGCTDPGALNYNEEATEDDGSCEYDAGENYLGFGELNDESFEVYVSNSQPIGGFQFDIVGVDVENAFGGLAEDSGFTISIGGQTIIGFSLTLNPISIGEGVLLNIDYSGYGDICLENVILSTIDGNSMEVNVGDCISTGEEPDFGCTDINACNYDQEATEDDGSCEYAEEYYDCNGDCD